MKKIWIDTDLVADDIFAIAMLIEAKGKIKVEGLSTISSYEKIQKITEDTKEMWASAGLPQTQVIQGVGYPIKQEFEEIIHSHKSKRKDNSFAPETHKPEKLYSAPKAIINKIMNNPKEITLLLMGPLTNIAIAYSLEPKIAKLVKEVVIMGGAVYCPGNITPTAEANFFHDPLAAKIVLGAEWPIVLAGLDVCDYCYVPSSLLDRFYSADKPLTPYISNSLPSFQEFLKTVGFTNEIYLPDPLAAAYLLAPEIFEFVRLPLYIETKGPCRGMSVPITKERWYKNAIIAKEFGLENLNKKIKVLLKADTDKFLSLILNLLT